MLGRRGFLGKLAAVIPGFVIANKVQYNTVPDEFAEARFKLSDDFKLYDHAALKCSGIMPRGCCSG